MKTMTRFPVAPALFPAVLGLSLLTAAATPITVDTQNLLVSVDPATCRWSAEVKGTPMQINDVHFLPGDDDSGWTVTSDVNRNDTNQFG